MSISFFSSLNLYLTLLFRLFVALFIAFFIPGITAHMALALTICSREDASTYVASGQVRRFYLSSKQLIYISSYAINFLCLFYISFIFIGTICFARCRRFCSYPCIFHSICEANICKCNFFDTFRNGCLIFILFILFCC